VGAEFGFLFWVLMILAAVVAVIVIQARLNYLRREMWRGLAAHYDLVYYPVDPFDIPNRYQFHLFSLGHARKAFNCLQGDYRNLPVLLFDYQYKTGSGKNETTHNVSALLGRLNIYCPYLIIRPQALSDRFAALLGFSDIQFESAEFNRAFNVKGDDKKFAYDICHPEMMAFLLKDQKLAWEFRGFDFLLYRWDMTKFDAARVSACLQLASEFTALIPDYLRREGQA
jgi:hypothetical protein